MKVPNINVAKAIRAYYTKAELSNEDIRELFDHKIGYALLQKLKKAAYAKNREMQKPTFSAYCVNTEAAFAAWELSIEQLSENYKKLKKLGLLEEEQPHAST